MKADDVVTPVLPRSTFDRSAGQRDATPVRIPTRGPRLRQSPVDDGTEFQVLIAQVRRRLPGVPLNVVLAGSIDSGTPGLTFLENLLGHIDPWLDAIWIIGGSATPPRTPAVVMLDTGKRDRKIGNNLVADILFLSGETERDLEVLRRFNRRVALLIIPSTAPHGGPLAAAATEMEIVALHWDAAQSKVHLATSADIDISGKTSELTSDEIDDMGRRLASLAKDLTKRRERRAIFRDTLVRLMRQFPLHPHWSRDLIDQAHKFSWPSWAVEMLPKLYLRLSDDADPVPALVWRPLFDWVADHQQYVSGDSLCKGDVLQVQIPQDLNALLSDLCAEIEENLRGNPFHGDEVFFGRISDAVSGVAVSRRAEQHELAERLLKLSRELLSRHV